MLSAMLLTSMEALHKGNVLCSTLLQLGHIGQEWITNDASLIAKNRARRRGNTRSVHPSKECCSY